MGELVKIYQDGGGDSISLLHGWGMNAGVFEPFSRQLARHFRVHRADLPGYGLSSRIPQDDFEQQVELLAQALPASVLVGWSMGGLYAIALARRYPKQFSQLVLVSSNPCFVQRDDWPCGMQAEVFNEFAESLLEDWQATIRRFIGLQVQGAAQARSLIRTINELLVKGGAPAPEALRFGLQLLLEQDLRQDLRKLSIPVLVILGQRDKLVPASLAQQLPELNPLIRVECVSRSSHAPFLSDSDHVEKLISEFVASTQAG